MKDLTTLNTPQLKVYATRLKGREKAKVLAYIEESKKRIEFLADRILENPNYKTAVSLVKRAGIVDRMIMGDAVVEIPNTAEVLNTMFIVASAKSGKRLDYKTIKRIRGV